MTAMSAVVLFSKDILIAFTATVLIGGSVTLFDRHFSFGYFVSSID